MTDSERPSLRWSNTAEAYGRLSRLFHWVTAALVAAAIPLGLYCASLARADPWREELLGIHKSLGLAVLALAVVRLAWIRWSPAPAMPGELVRWEARLARTAHRTLYALLLAVPLSGLCLSLGAGREVGFFGLFELPPLIPIDPAVPPAERPVVIVAAILHKTVLDAALFVVLALHLGGVVKHHVLDGHRHLVRRMLG